MKVYFVLLSYHKQKLSFISFVIVFYSARRTSFIIPKVFAIDLCALALLRNFLCNLFICCDKRACCHNQYCCRDFEQHYLNKATYCGACAKKNDESIIGADISAHVCEEKYCQGATFLRQTREENIERAYYRGCDIIAIPCLGSSLRQNVSEYSGEQGGYRRAIEECMEGVTDTNTNRSLLSNIGKKGCVSALVWAHLCAAIGSGADTPNQSMRTQYGRR